MVFIGNYQLTSSPAVSLGQVVSLDEIKTHLREDTSDNDQLLSSYLEAAVDIAERDLRRQFLTATWTLTLPYFPSVIELRKLPVQSVTSITYRDPSGTTQTLSTDVYELFADREPAEIREKPNQNWPAVEQHLQAVTVTFVAGYGSSVDVPEAIKAGIKLTVEQMFDGCDLQRTIDYLLSRYQWSVV